jgi:hypothetical protein
MINEYKIEEDKILLTIEEDKILLKRIKFH